jgi:hypothetical protein
MPRQRPPRGIGMIQRIGNSPRNRSLNVSVRLTEAFSDLIVQNIVSTGG